MDVSKLINKFTPTSFPEGCAVQLQDEEYGRQTGKPLPDRYLCTFTLQELQCIRDILKQHMMEFL